MPDGKLTAVQHEIMLIIWAAGRSGATVGEIWKAVSEQRDVGRTTILNLVDRLESRGWLRRTDASSMAKKATCFVATVSQKQASANLAKGFVDDFFGGSASDLVSSLLGSRRLNSAEIERLKSLLEDAETRANRKKEDKK